MLTKIADYFNVDMNYLFGFNKKSGIETTGRARMEEVIVVETTVGDGKKSPIIEELIPCGVLISVR